MVKIALVNANELSGKTWNARDYVCQEVKLTYWEQLKKIAARRRALLIELTQLDDEEVRIRRKIEEK